MAHDKIYRLTAKYTSPFNQPFVVVANSISAPSSDGVAEKIRYLETLRQTVDDAQAQINKDLTERMEKDKLRDATAGRGSAKLDGVDEEKEEANYGEEVQDEE
ncbi:hypothetical protein CDD83_1297 [Cordyceps sp. RAO-2017]|nr:hypothetical protein CDD83_1297 [Cordyceps sp. RAO-2017]